MRRSPSSSESTSSQKHERRRADARPQRIGLGEDEREDRDALLALRAERAQVAAPRLDTEIVKVGPRAGEPALEIVLETSVQLRDSRRLAFVRERRRSQAELVRDPLEQRREELDGFDSAPARGRCRATRRGLSRGTSASRVEAPARTRRSPALR